MTLLWHIAKKDLRHLRWPMIAWVLLTVIEALLRAVGPLFVDVSRNEMWYALDTITNFVPLLRGLLYLVIVALLVLADPLVGTESFWLTRPIPRRTLLASKLLLGALILILPSLLTEIVLMLGFRVPPMEVAGVVPDILLGSIVMLVCVVFAATLAGSLTQFILGLIGIAIAGWTGLAVYVMVAMTGTREFEPSVPYYNTTPRGEVTFLIVMLIALLGTTWYHYRTRRRGRSLLLAIASLAFVYVLGENWPDATFERNEPQLPAAMQDPTVTALRLTRPIRHVFDERAHFMGRPPHRRIAAPLVLDGVPDGYLPEPFTVRATVRTPGGAAIESQRSFATIVDVESGHARPTGGGGAFLTVGAPRSRKPGTIVETWPVLFRAPVDTLRQAGTNVGEYSGTFLFDFTHVEPLATMPLSRELQFADGPRSLTVWVLGERGGACSILVRRTALQARSWGIRRPNLIDTFRDRGTTRRLTMHVARGTNASVQFGGGWSTDSNQGRSFYIFYQQIDILPEGAIYGGPPTGSVSCDAVELVLERHSYAGRLVRTLTLPNFRLDAQPDDLTGDESNGPW